MIGLIVAYANNNIIGNKGIIPWKIKGEQQRFKELTVGNVVVMGRRSYEEIGKPLPNRKTIVVSRNKIFNSENCCTVSSLREALEIAGDSDIFVSGGAQLYRESLDIVDKMFITEIDLDVEGDTYFPEFDETKFKKEVDMEFNGEISYKYVTYTRIA